MQEKEEKSKVEQFKSNLLKTYGKKDSVLIKTSDVKYEKFGTGSPKLNYHLKGGYVKGTIVEFFGFEKSGKTTSCIEGAVQFQKTYPEEPILWVDIEKVFDPEYFSYLGLDLDEERFILVRPGNGETTFELIKDFCNSFDGGLIVVDSVAMLLPSKEDEQEMGSHQMGAQAKMMSQGLRKIFPHLSKSNATVFFVNQLREKLGVMFGDPTVTSGGKSLAFYARTRIKVSRVKGENTEEAFGCNLFLEKATYGDEGVKIETHLLKTGGFDKVQDIIDLAINSEIIAKNGNTYSYKDIKLGVGKSVIKPLLTDNLELLEQIEKEIYNGRN
jgi:recombination protein RecA